MPTTLRSRPVHAVCVSLALALLLAACGGGGGGGGGGDDMGMTPTFSDALFDGRYGVAACSFSTTNGTTRAEGGFGTADGMGMLTPSIGSNDGTTVTPIVAGAPIPYSVMADGSLTLADEGGLLAADGAGALLMKDDPMAIPGIRVLVRLDDPYTEAVFSGSYHGAMFTAAQAQFTSTATGFFVADGVGALTLPASLRRNTGGTHGTIGSAGSTTFGIRNNGLLTAELPGGVEGHGGISVDGLFAVVAGDTLANAVQLLQVFVKVAAGASNGTFSGTYLVAGIQSDPDSGNAYATFVGRAVADGAGNLTVQPGQQNEEGTISMSSGDATTYSVAADGSLTVDKLLGAVSTDGRWGFLAGETDDGDGMTTERPSLFVLIRQ